jgi:hypothetical protein
MLPFMKWYVTVYGNGMLPLYATQVSYPKQYATALGNRLWKWYVTALCNPSKLPKTICNHFRQPLMEMVCYRLSSYLPSYATAYRNGRQPLYATVYGNGVSPPKIPRTAAPILKKG